MTVFSETLTVNLRFHDFWGYQKLKTKCGFHWNQGYSTEKEGRWISLKPKVFNWEGVGWYSLKPRVFDWEEGLRPPSQSKPLVSMKPPNLLLSRNPWFQWNHLPSFSVETLGFNETTFSFNFWTTKKSWNRRYTVKVSLKPSKKKSEVSF